MMKNRKLKFGGFSLLVTLLFIAGVVLVNILVGQLTDRFYLKADLTEQGIYTLSAQTEEALGALTQEVRITVLGEETSWENDIRNRLSETLRNYESIAGGAIKLQYVEAALNPQLITEYPLITDLTDGHIIIESDSRYTSVHSSDLFEWATDETGNYVPASLNAEQPLTSAILYVTSDKIARAVFIEGHSEGSTTELQKLFENANYECETVNLAFGELPEDTSVVICASPKSDFQTVEIDRLDAYMRSGGNAMIFYELNTPKLGNLELYLEEWGIAFENKLVLDDQYNFGMLYAIAGLPNSEVEHLPTLTASESKNYLMMSISRPVTTMWATGERGYRKLSPVVFSMPNSYAKPFEEGSTLENAERESADDAGPFILTMLSHDNSASPANMIVSNYGLVSDSALSGSAYFFNAQMMGMLANDLNTSGQSVIIAGKALAGTQLNVMPGQARAILVVMVIILPLLIMLAGIVVWRKRKSL